MKYGHIFVFIYFQWRFKLLLNVLQKLPFKIFFRIFFFWAILNRFESDYLHKMRNQLTRLSRERQRKHCFGAFSFSASVSCVFGKKNTKVTNTRILFEVTMGFFLTNNSILHNATGDSLLMATKVSNRKISFLKISKEKDSCSNTLLSSTFNNSKQKLFTSPTQ